MTIIGIISHYMCLFAEPIVQWYYNSQAIKPSKYFQMNSQGGKHTLTITGAFPEDEGVYKCTARNQAGEVTCIAHLRVHCKYTRVRISLDLRNHSC